MEVGLSHPVMIAFLDVLTGSVAERKNAGDRGVNVDGNDFPDEEQSVGEVHVVRTIPASELARRRWWLAYTLVRNPDLVSLRRRDVVRETWTQMSQSCVRRVVDGLCATLCKHEKSDCRKTDCKDSPEEHEKSAEGWKKADDQKREEPDSLQASSKQVSVDERDLAEIQPAPAKASPPLVASDDVDRVENGDVMESLV